MHFTDVVFITYSGYFILSSAIMPTVISCYTCFVSAEMQLVYISPDLSRVNNHIETFVNYELNSSLLTGTGGSKSLQSTPREHEAQDTVQIWSAGNKETTERQRRPIGNSS